MTDFELATLTVQWITVAVQCLTVAVVAWGIFSMRQATERRAADARAETRRLADADERRHDEAKQQHAEAMRALDVLIDGQRQQGEALRQQGEALAALVREQGEARREQGEALRQQGEALAVLIARTAPPGQ